MTLIKCGFSLAAIDAMSDSEMLAWQIAAGEAEGGQWSWSEMRWREAAR
jgi:hypothetical protein